MSTEFKLNDRVEWLGLRGVITALNHNDHPIYIQVEFENSTGPEYFFKDGRYLENQIPSLKKIQTVRIEKWLNIYPVNLVYDTYYHDTKDEADKRAGSDRIACVKLVGEYESS